MPRSKVLATDASRSQLLGVLHALFERPKTFHEILTERNSVLEALRTLEGPGRWPDAPDFGSGMTIAQAEAVFPVMDAIVFRGLLSPSLVRAAPIHAQRAAAGLPFFNAVPYTLDTDVNIMVTDDTQTILVPNGFASSGAAQKIFQKGNYGVDGWRPVHFQGFALLLMEHELSHLIISALEAPYGEERDPSYYTPFYCTEGQDLIMSQLRDLQYPALQPLLEKLSQTRDPFRLCHSPYWHCLTYAAFGHIGNVTVDNIKGIIGRSLPKSFVRGPVVWQAMNAQDQLKDILSITLFE